MFDIDDFNKINDTFGHNVGDKVLIELTKGVKTILRKTDLLFRVGGEEFVIIYPKTELLNGFNATQKVLKFNSWSLILLKIIG